jgi:hypothetical protein
MAQHQWKAVQESYESCQCLPFTGLMECFQKAEDWRLVSGKLIFDYFPLQASLLLVLSSIMHIIREEAQAMR